MQQIMLFKKEKCIYIKIRTLFSGHEHTFCILEILSNAFLKSIVKCLSLNPVFPYRAPVSFSTYISLCQESQVLDENPRNYGRPLVAPSYNTIKDSGIKQRLIENAQREDTGFSGIKRYANKIILKSTFISVPQLCIY